jgi:ubiquinone/menaquinone biosynthesis C-methylase UbiE
MDTMSDHQSEADHDDVVRDSFSRQTELFTGDDAVFARRAIEATAWLEPLGPEMIVLDVACGAAHAAEQVAPRVRQVVGVDLTASLLAVGAQRLRDAGVTNVLLQEGSAAALPFVDGSFDLVFCRAALHHFGEQHRAVGEMARVCRPGGRVVVADMVAPNAAVRRAFDNLHRTLDPSHVAVMLDHELEAELAEAVGPVRMRPGASFTLPLDHILTDVADRDAVVGALRAELDGGPATGFHPTLDDDGRIVVGFTNAVAEAVRAGV